MGYTVQFTCKSKALAGMTGELLAKYYPSSNRKDTVVEEDCWELLYIKDLTSKLKSENHEIRQMFTNNIALSSEVEQWDGSVLSFMKCKFEGYEDQEILKMILKKCECKVRSKFDEKVNYLVIDFSRVTSKTLPSILKKIQQIKEKNAALKVFSLSDFLSAILSRIEKCTASRVNCIYGKFEGDEPGDCLEVAEDGTINITCPCGMDSDDAYSMAEENGESVEDYMFFINEDGCVYYIADALKYIIPKMDRMYKWTGRIESASAFTEEENYALTLLGDMADVNRKGMID